MSGSETRLTHARDVYPPARIAEFKASGLWRDTLLVDLLDGHRAHRPDEVALVVGAVRMTWSELATAVDRVAAGFVDLGLVPGDFVAVQMPNCAEFVAVYLAVQRAGLRAITMLSIYREHDVRYMLEKTGARAYVALDTHRGFDFVAMAGRLARELPTLEHVVIAGEADPGMIRLADLEVTPTPGAFRHLRPDPDGMSKIGFTSGTTGRPKGVVHTHNTDLVPPILVANAVGLDASTPIWMPSPIAHVTGILFGLYDALLVGAKLVLQDVWDPEAALALIERERAAFTVSATPFVAGMLEVPDRHRYDLSSFRYFVSGGARVPGALVERARDELGIDLLRVFGSSEAPLHTINYPDDPMATKAGRDGRAIPGAEIRIVDPEDHARVLGPGERGEYATRGPHVFLGYFEEPELTAECRDDEGWYTSGDLCTIDEDGYVLYLDRLKDIVNRGGVKYSAAEVENLLVAHPAVTAVAVVAVADPQIGERACAFVVPRGGTPPRLADLTAFLEERGVTRQKWPERLELIDALPMTPTGKVQKIVLRDRLSSGP